MKGKWLEALGGECRIQAECGVRRRQDYHHPDCRRCHGGCRVNREIRAAGSDGI